VDHQPGYHVAAMGTEAVRFLVLWMAGWIHSVSSRSSTFYARRTASSESSSEGGACGSPENPTGGYTRLVGARDNLGHHNDVGGSR
jgi:hypothetical protein